MTAGYPDIDTRLEELLAAEAAGELDAGESRELDQLLAADTIPDRDAFVRVAGLVQTSFLRKDVPAHQRMPAELQARLLQQANDFFDGTAAHNDNATVTDIASARKRSPDQRRWLNPAAYGWLVAAGLALVFLVFRSEVSAPPAGMPAAELRAALMEQADTLVLAWRLPTEPGYEQVTGDVVWHTGSQSGYLRLAGMPANDRRRMQYQLWIIDPDRDRQPVDGGVFDIPDTDGEIIVPINAKLNIIDPKAFAITAEKPGGVVVSDGPLLVVAGIGERPPSAG